MVGTGGASGALGTCLVGDADESRKVRSVIDPELDFRCRVGLELFAIDPATELDTEETDAFLRRFLLVWTSATDVGVVGLDRRAVAAAADEREALEVWLFKKAWTAAEAAFGLALDPLRGC
jgi:hypothetical protein